MSASQQMNISSTPEWRLEPVKLIELTPSTQFPRLIAPADSTTRAFGDADRERARAALDESGAIVLRGFDVADEAAFERLAGGLCQSLEPSYGDLIKRDTASFVYDATRYPHDRAILFHNEGSHTPRLPTRQFFFCGKDGFSGGETPFVDCRAVFAALNRDVAQRFERLGLLYVRNFIRGVDVAWQDFFRTENRLEVERRCAEQGVEWTWKRDGGLRIATRVPAVLRHPRGQLSFCNQIFLHHVACLDAKTAGALRAVLPAADLPRNVHFGDGTPISDELVFELLQLTVQHAVRFSWQRGDVLLLDNLSTAHARSPFEGERQILVAVGDVVARQGLKAA